MKARFVRGASSREEILDRVLDRLITIELPVQGVVLDDEGHLDIKHPFTRSLVEDFQKARVSWKVSDDDDGWVYIELTGTKASLIRILPMWDSFDRNEAELAKALKDWDGNMEQLYSIIN